MEKERERQRETTSKIIAKCATMHMSSYMYRPEKNERGSFEANFLKIKHSFFYSYE